MALPPNIHFTLIIIFIVHTNTTKKRKSIDFYTYVYVIHTTHTHFLGRCVQVLCVCAENNNNNIVTLFSTNQMHVSQLVCTKNDTHTDHFVKEDSFSVNLSLDSNDSQNHPSEHHEMYITVFLSFMNGRPNTNVHLPSSFFTLIFVLYLPMCRYIQMLLLYYHKPRIQEDTHTLFLKRVTSYLRTVFLHTCHTPNSLQTLPVLVFNSSFLTQERFSLRFSLVCAPQKLSFRFPQD